MNYLLFVEYSKGLSEKLYQKKLLTYYYLSSYFTVKMLCGGSDYMPRCVLETEELSKGNNSPNTLSYDLVILITQKVISVTLLLDSEPNLQFRM